MKQKKSSAVFDIQPKDITTSVSLVEKAAVPFADRKRLTSADRRQMARAKRGARQFIASLVDVSTKFGVVIAGVDPAVMTNDAEQARVLEPLLAEIGSLYDVVRDEHLRSQSAAWKAAVVMYGVLKKNAEANAKLEGELEPLTRWFKSAVKGRKAATDPTTTNAAPAADANVAKTTA